MTDPTEQIISKRLKLKAQYGDEADNIIFTIFNCPSCERELIDIVLMPIQDINLQDKSSLRIAKTKILEQLENKAFDFLKEIKTCDCSFLYPKQMILTKIIYCNNLNGSDEYYIIDPLTHSHSHKKQENNYLNEVIVLDKKHPEEDLGNSYYLFFDTETTGLPKNRKLSYKQVDNWPRLVQIAWQAFDKNERLIHKSSFIIKPTGFSIPSEATNIHKITTQQAIEKGRFLKEVLENFNSLIDSSTFIIAHNLNYDENVIAAEFYRQGIKTSLFTKRRICTMEATINFCKIPGIYGYNYPKLSELYFKLFNEAFKEAHNAENDINATVKCFFRLKNQKTISI